MNEMLKDDPTEFQRLRAALLGNDISLIKEANQQLRDPELFSNRLADNLTAAVLTADAKSNKFSFNLRDPLLKSLSVAAQTKPEELSKSLAPIIGKAVMEAVADAMRTVNEHIEAVFTKSFTINGLKWRFQSWRTGEPYSRIAMRSSHSFQILRVAYLSKRQGKLLSSVQAKGALEQRGLESQNELLESLAMKMQINANASEISPVDTADAQAYVAHSAWAALAVVCWGTPPENLTQKMMLLLEYLGEEYAIDLKRFKTDASLFESAKPLLSELMNSYQQADKRSADKPKKRLSTLGWILLLGLPILLCLAYIFLNNQQKNTVLKSLQEQSGFVLNTIEGNIIQGWQVNGMVDPIGFNKARVENNPGLINKNVKMSLVPYISLEPKLVLQRAQLKLDVPQSVDMSINNNAGILEVVAIGNASQSWINQARLKEGGLVGVDKLNLTQVVADKIKFVEVLPDPEVLVSEIEGMNVLFSDKNQLEDNQEIVLAQLDTKIKELAEMSQKRKEQFKLKIIGNATPTGAARFNNDLQESRAKVVEDWLIAHQVDQNLIATELTDTPLPIKAVTFKVELTKLD